MRKRTFMSSLVIAALVATTITYARDDADAGGGAVPSQGVIEDASWLTRDHWQFVDALRPAVRARTFEEEMQHLHEVTFAAQQAQRLVVRDTTEHSSWITRDLWQYARDMQFLATE